MRWFLDDTSSIARIRLGRYPVRDISPSSSGWSRGHGKLSTITHRPPPGKRDEAGGRRGGLGSLEPQFPQPFKGRGAGRILPGRDPILQFVFGFPVLPDNQNTGGEGCRSQQAHDQGANRSARVRGSPGSRCIHLQVSCRKAKRKGWCRNVFLAFELGDNRGGPG
jgi:hypothetical protein